MTDLLLISSTSNPPASLRRRVFKSELPEFDISRDSALDLADLWEGVETFYVCRLEKITLAARTQASLTRRCLLFTKKQFSRFLGRENAMQASVDAFIKVYNRAPRPWNVSSTDDITSQVERLTEKMKGRIFIWICGFYELDSQLSFDNAMVIIYLAVLHVN
jgi:hypothetical protein